MTLWKISDKDIRQCHFLKSTCNIGPPRQGPQWGLQGDGVRGDDSGNLPWGRGIRKGGQYLSPPVAGPAPPLERVSGQLTSADSAVFQGPYTGWGPGGAGGHIQGTPSWDRSQHTPRLAASATHKRGLCPRPPPPHKEKQRRTTHGLYSAYKKGRLSGGAPGQKS